MRPDLLKKMLVPMLVMTVITVALLIILPIFAHAPQVKLMEARGWNPTMCHILGVIIIPAEVGLGSYITFTMAFGMVTSEIKQAAIVARGVDKKILERYNLEELPTTTKIQDMATNVQFMIMQIIVMICTFPMNVAPGIGQGFWILWNGWLVTWEGQADLLPMIRYGSKLSQIKHMFCHLVSYFGFGFVAFAICLIPLANIAWAGGIAYGHGLLFEAFVDYGDDGPDPLPVPGFIETAMSGIAGAGNKVASVAGGAWSGGSEKNARNKTNETNQTV